jgi:hypothetical protein
LTYTCDEMTGGSIYTCDLLFMMNLKPEVMTHEKPWRKKKKIQKDWGGVLNVDYCPCRLQMG